VVECRYTHEGAAEVWAHRVTPVVESPLWWRANKILEANMTDARENRGGRPVAQAANWLSGILGCPSCGAKLHVNGGLTPAGNPRTPKLRCGGHAKQRKACGVFTGCDARPVIDVLDAMLSGDATPILAFQRVAGNSHELDEKRAELVKIKGRLSVTDDDRKLDDLLARMKAVRAEIAAFTVVPDVYDYAPTGQTVGQMWSAGDTDAKRGMVRAVKESWGLALAENGGRWEITIGAGFTGASGGEDIVDLGNGLCFRREIAHATV
jgi:hypothetical protein